MPADQQQDCDLWVTPTTGDVTETWLIWNATSEQFEAPRVVASQLPDGVAGGAANSETGCPETGFQDVSVAPVAVLSTAGGGSRVFHAARRPRDDRQTSLAAGRWVSLKEILQGYTSEGRAVDAVLRQFAEMTGRAKTGPWNDESLLIVGAVGHRQLADDDVPVLFDKMHQAIEDLLLEFPGRRLQILTTLAPGAGQMLADIAIERNLPFVAVLPCPLEHYEREFPHARALEEFRSTLKAAHSWYSLPDHTLNLRPDVRDLSTIRQQCTARAGRHLVHHSNVLLAVWDGLPSLIPGAPADILRYALETPRRPGHRLLIRHIPAQRGQRRDQLP